MLLAQLTDTHIHDPAVDDPDHLVDNAARLELAVASLGREQVRPDAVLATGDLTDNGLPLEVDLLLDLLSPLEMPVLALPGNHDVRDTFAPAFDLPWASPTNLSWVVDVGRDDDAVRVIGVDTLDPGSHGGLLDTERLTWLEEVLADSGDRPTVIAMHHPPFASGIHWMDAMGLVGAERFEDLVAGRTNVERILCGHLHRPLISTVGGVTASVGPSTIHHVELDLTPDAPIAVIADPAGYQLHQRRGGRWVSHIRYIDTGVEPVRPAWST